MDKMKTGFDNLLENHEENTKKDIVSYVTLFLENAIRSAVIYATKHGDRNVITAEDIKRCMMLEVFLFIKRPGIDQQIVEMKTKLFYEDDDDDDVIVEDKEEDNFEENTCQCGLCTCITGIYTRWNDWTPSNKMEEIFQKHINNM